MQQDAGLGPYIAAAVLGQGHAPRLPPSPRGPGLFLVLPQAGGRSSVPRAGAEVCESSDSP